MQSCKKVLHIQRYTPVELVIWCQWHRMTFVRSANLRAALRVAQHSTHDRSRADSPVMQMSFYGTDIGLPVWHGYYWWITLSKLATLLKQHSMSVLSYLDWYFLACKFLTNSSEKTWSMHILHDSLNWWNRHLFYRHIYLCKCDSKPSFFCCTFHKN